MPATLFVTALIDSHIVHKDLKSDEERIRHFVTLAKTSIDLVVFTSRKYQGAIEAICRDYRNVRIHKIVEVEDTYTYTVSNAYRDRLPKHRNPVKDSYEFLAIINAKIEFLHEAVRAYDYKQYAWIDFNLWHVIRNVEESTRKLQRLSTQELPKQAVYAPGCWPKCADGLWERIVWRFCGGFLIGHKSAIVEFTELYMKHIKDIVEEKGGITWEVNLWAHLENQYGWKPEWYLGNHDDTILLSGD
jgi:hypothetical protein